MKFVNFLRAALCVCGVASMLLVSMPMRAADGGDEENNEIWQQLRKTIFEGRPINAGKNEVIKLFLPSRAEDAAVVPVLIRTTIDQTPARFIKKVYLVIDKNPSPIGVVFNMTPESGRADIETRVRVETYTPIRAVAEMNDGQLFMATKIIIASGGCSAPAGNGAGQMSNLGKMRIRLDGEAQMNQPLMAQLMIQHPNFSGLGSNDSNVHFVKHVRVTYAGKEIMSAEVDFTISENPNFRFYFVPKEQGELRAEVVDTKDLKFESSLMVKPGS